MVSQKKYCHAEQELLQGIDNLFQDITSAKEKLIGAETDTANAVLKRKERGNEMSKKMIENKGHARIYD